MALTTTSRFRLVLWIFALLCSRNTLAEPAVSSEVNRPASTRSRNPSDEFDVRLHSVSRRTADDFGTQKPRFTRHLLQEDTDSSKTDYLCSIQENMTEYLDTATRTWRIDGAALNAIDNDVQAIVNCTTEGDTLLFDVGVVIRPRARITIPWNLTISAATGRTRRVNGLYPKAPQKATITCPTEGEGVFLVRSKSVLFANLRFENCSLRGSSGSEAIVQVEECQFNRTQDAVQLHHVSFERNTLIDAAALSVKGPSCARLELVDFEFSDSDCGGRCGVTLSAQNRLRNIRIHQIRFFDSANRSSTVFYGSDGSETSIKRMNATENECSLLHVEGGTLNVSDSTFLENDMYSTRENDVRFCIRLSNSTGSIQDSQFRRYKVRTGSAVTATASNLTVIGCVFENNSATSNGGSICATDSRLSIQMCRFENGTAESGGAISMESGSSGLFVNTTFRNNLANENGGICHVEDSELVVQKCHITEGSAKNGGAIFALFSRITFRETVASNLTAAKHGGVISGNASVIRMTDCSVLNNVAADRGGVMECHPDCTFTGTESNYSRNSAGYGGVINLDKNCSGSISGSKFDKNNASESGGSIYLGESTFSIRQCTFSESNATWGGFIYVTETRMDISNSNFDQGSAMDGGCTRITNGSEVMFQDVKIASCKAESTGGAVQFLSNSTGILKNVYLDENSAPSTAGSVLVQESNASFDHCTFQKGHAEYGGLLAVISGSINMRHSVLQKSTAEWGACLHCNGCSMLLQNVTMQECRAELSGGAIGMAFSSEATVQNSVFVRNYASFGGSIDLSRSSSLFGDGLLFEDNTVEEEGGALVSQQASTIEINNSVFRNNTGRVGGVLIQYRNTTGIFTNVTFDKNWANRDGGVVYATTSNISFDRCVFERSSAEHGGFLYSRRSVRCHLSRSVLINGTAQEGGCIVVEKGNLTLQKTSIHTCIASKDGGALHLSEEANATVTDSSIDASHAGEHGGGVYMSRSSLSANRLLLTGNIAKGDGGGIFSEHSTGIRIINDSYFGNNSAQSGGGVALRNTTGSLIGVRIYGNSASTHGGACWSESSSLKMVGCTIRHSEAGSGGSFFVRMSELKLTSSKLKAGWASAEGGFISATENSSIRADRTSMIAGVSKEGGAVFLFESVFTATGIRITQCKADGDGGAIKGIDSSRMLCSGCTLSNNNATRGGAIFAMHNDTRMISMQLDNCTLQNNSATFGGILDQTRSRVKFTFFHAGGVQVMAGSESVFRDCRAGWDTCKVTTLMNTVFADNEAKAAGGAVFIDTVAGLRLSCSDESAGQGLEFYSEKRWKSMKRLTSVDDVCPSWKNNSAGRYGPDVASYASDVLKKVTNKKTKWLSPSDRNHYTIRRHKSGRPILIAFTPVDDLEQSPAVGMDNNDIEAVTFSPDGFFVGRVKVSLNAAVVNISTTGFVQPDEYTVQIDFEGADLESLEITVEVQKCEIGEVPSANGTFCEPCSVASYNFYPEEDLECHPCPENGDCSSQVILPNRGYWHRTPCAEHIQKCFTTEACDSGNREDELAKRTRDLQTCQFDDQYLQNYTEVQCREVSIVLNYGLLQGRDPQGHEGPLCGSCKKTYGKSHSHLCEKCFSGFGDVVLIVLSLLVLLGLSSITIRSNLISVLSSPNQQRTRTFHSSIASTRTRAVPTEQTIELAAAKDVAEQSSSVRHSERDHPDPSTDTELAKWKAAELVKIAVNFLQVTAIAVAVNVKWTLAMVAIFQTAEFISAVTSEAVNRSVDCLAPLGASIQRSIASTLVDISQPLVAILTFAVFWLAIKIWFAKDWMYLLKRCILSALVVCYVSYISITKTLINILNCVQVHDSTTVGIDGTTDYWILDTSVECYQGSHAALAFLLACPFLFIFSLGFPLLIAYVVIVKVKEDYKDGWIYDVAGFVYRSFSKKYIFWESVIMSRKAVLAVVVVFSYKLGASIQAVLASFVLIMALYLQTKCRPYRVEFDCLNDLESLSILLSCLTFICSIFFGDDRVSYGLRVLISVFLCFANIVLVLYLLTLFVIYEVEYMKTVLVREGIHPSPAQGTLRVLRAYFFDYLFIDMKEAMVRWVHHGRSRRYHSYRV